MTLQEHIVQFLRDWSYSPMKNDEMYTDLLTLIQLVRNDVADEAAQDLAALIYGYKLQYEDEDEGAEPNYDDGWLDGVRAAIANVESIKQEMSK